MANEQRQLKLPLAFSGSAQLLLYTRYGDPRIPGWANKWITTWKVRDYFPWFPAEEIKVHKHFWPILKEAFIELSKTGLYKEIKTFNNCYELSYLCNSPVLSVHSWGAAVDMNAEENPKGAIGTWSPEFIKVMEKYHICCGQTWNGNHNAMHFSMVEG